MKPSSPLPEEQLQPINEHLSTFPAVLKEINAQFSRVDQRIKQQKMGRNNFKYEW